MTDLLWGAAKKVESVTRYVIRNVSADSSSQPSCCRNRIYDAFGFRAGSSCSALIRLAGISGAAAVALAAYSSHVVTENRDIDDRRKKALENGNKQHFLHTFALILSHKAKFPVLTAGLFGSGILLFSVPCYIYGLRNDSRLRFITPVGGILFILGWLSFTL